TAPRPARKELFDDFGDRLGAVARDDHDEGAGQRHVGLGVHLAGRDEDEVALVRKELPLESRGAERESGPSGQDVHRRLAVAVVVDEGAPARRRGHYRRVDALAAHRRAADGDLTVEPGVLPLLGDSLVGTYSL